MSPAAAQRSDVHATGAMCVDCGTKVTGPYCYECGAASGRVECRRCGGTMRPGFKFCTSCGSEVSRFDLRQGLPRIVPWAIGLTLVAVLLAALWRPSVSATDVAPQGLGAPAGAPTPPDLSTMSPRQRFDRLYGRIIEAAQKGDQATVERFLPMAIGAYQGLDTVDADARYHLAMLQLHVGNVSGARAQADSILTQEPDHLFGYVIAAAVDRWTGDEAHRQDMYRKFTARYAAETARNRPEYAEHQGMLLEVKKLADSAGR